MPGTRNGLPATRLHPALITLLLLAPGAHAQAAPEDIQARIAGNRHWVAWTRAVVGGEQFERTRRPLVS